MPEENEVKIFKKVKEKKYKPKIFTARKTVKCKEHRLLLTYDDPKNIVPMRFF